MKIKYTGTRTVKTVSVAGKDIVFNPTAKFNEIFDLPIIKWLLHPDRQGLFVVEEIPDKTPSIIHPEITKTTEIPKEIISEDKKGRGRPKKRG